MNPIDAEGLREILRGARRIAIVGLSPNPHRPSHQVAAYLQSAGYVIVPVRPAIDEVLGMRAWPDLASAAAGTGPIDIVDVFRRSEWVPDLVQDCIAIRPSLVFLQVGVIHEESARRLEKEGIPVIMNRCLMVDHLRLLGA